MSTQEWDSIRSTSFVFILANFIFLGANIWVLYKNPKLMTNWSSLGTFVFNIILLITHSITLFFIFFRAPFTSNTYGSFAIIEATTLMMTCVSYNLLI